MKITLDTLQDALINCELLNTRIYCLAVKYLRNKNPWSTLYLWEREDNTPIEKMYPEWKDAELALFRISRDWADNKYGSSYTAGFTEGFLDITLRNGSPNYEKLGKVDVKIFERYIEGRKDGTACIILNITDIYGEKNVNK